MKLEFNKETGVLVINLGKAGKNAKVVEGDALVLVTVSEGKIIDIEILFSDKVVVEKLSGILKKKRKD